MIQPPLNYTGSKFKLLDQILPELNYKKEKFVDLFAGGGSVYANVLDKYEKIIVNDIIKDLVNVHKGILESDEIIELTKLNCKDLKINKELYDRLRDSYNGTPSADKLWALILSCNSNLIRFNQKGEFNQTWGKRSWNPSTDKKLDSYKSHIRRFKEKIKFESKSFEMIEIDENMMIYIDPPYGYVKDKSGEIGNKQISEAGYNNFYHQKDDLNLYQFCHKINEIGSSFMISGVLEHGGQTTWILDKLISDGFTFKELNCNYEKINKSGNDKNTIEIIVKNY